MRSGLVVVATVSMLAFTAITFLWIWRDMAWRKRPTWLRVLVLALMWPTLLGLFIWMVDRYRHPHDLALTRWEVLRQARDQRAGGS